MRCSPLANWRLAERRALRLFRATPRVTLLQKYTETTERGSTEYRGEGGRSKLWRFRMETTTAAGVPFNAATVGRTGILSD